MITLKSVTPILRGSEWVIRIREKNSRPVLSVEWVEGVNAGYTMHQAELYASNVRRNYARHGSVQA